MNSAPPVTAARYTTPSTPNVRSGPIDSINRVAIGAVMSAPLPKPATAIPVINPRLSGNHFTSVATGTMYPRPRPMPPRRPYDRYNRQRCPSDRLAEQTPTPYRTPAVSATTRGPALRIQIPPPNAANPSTKIAIVKVSVTSGIVHPNVFV